VAVCNGDFRQEWDADQLVEWDVLGAVSDAWLWTPCELEWELVSEWEPIAAVLDSGSAWKPDAAEREWTAGFGFVQWEVFDCDELAGDCDSWNPFSRWEPNQLGQRDVLGAVSALYAMIEFPPADALKKCIGDFNNN
jgi:hypothetical protein